MDSEFYIDEWEGVYTVRSIYGGTQGVFDYKEDADQALRELNKINYPNKGTDASNY